MYLKSMSFIHKSWLDLGLDQNYRYYHIPTMNSEINAPTGVTNQRETAIAWRKSTGKPLHRAIVWGDSRNKNMTSRYEMALRRDGLDGQKDDDAITRLRELWAIFKLNIHSAASDSNHAGRVFSYRRIFQL